MRAILLGLVLAGCATAELISSADGVHTIRVETDEVLVGTNSVFLQALADRASKTCPSGWEKIGQAGITRDPPLALMTPTTAYEWRIICR